jgi:hypothetical protein
MMMIGNDQHVSPQLKVISKPQQQHGPERPGHNVTKVACNATAGREFNQRPHHSITVPILYQQLGYASRLVPRTAHAVHWARDTPARRRHPTNIRAGLTRLPGGLHLTCGTLTVYTPTRATFLQYLACQSGPKWLTSIVQ